MPRRQLVIFHVADHMLLSLSALDEDVPQILACLVGRFILTGKLCSINIFMRAYFYIILLVGWCLKFLTFGKRNITLYTTILFETYGRKNQWSLYWWQVIVVRPIYLSSMEEHVLYCGEPVSSSSNLPCTKLCSFAMYVHFECFWLGRM